MRLEEIERSASRAQILSLVDAMSFKLALWFGAVSSGKTVISLWAFLLAVRVAPRTGIIVIVGRTMTTVYQNVFVLFQNTAIFGTTIASQISYTPGAPSARILGREVMVIGASNVEAVGRIQGSTVALAYVDEAALLPEVFWNMLVSRLRVEGDRLLATMNPASRNHWMRKNWIIPGAAKNLISFHFTMKDNPNLPADYIADMERSFSGVFYDRMIKGEWTNAAGAVFPMWDPARHIISFDQMPRIHRTVGTGIDFGTSNPSAALMLGVGVGEKPRLVLMDEWRYNPKDHDGQRLAPSDQAARYKAWLGTQHAPQPLVPAPEFQIVDPAAAHFQEELFKIGVTTWHGDNDVLAGIATMSRLLDNDQLVVSDRCAGFLSEVTEYRWSDKATTEGRDEPVKEDDHSLDAGRYITHTARQSYEYDLIA
jgi:PBSX family phage terminase large subunit